LYTWNLNNATLADLKDVEQQLICSTSIIHLVNYTAVTQADIADCFCRDTPSSRRSRRNTGTLVDAAITIRNATNVNITSVAANANSAPVATLGTISQTAVAASLVIPTTTTTVITTLTPTTTATPIAEPGPSKKSADIKFTDPEVYWPVAVVGVLVLGVSVKTLIKRSRNPKPYPGAGIMDDFLL